MKLPQKCSFGPEACEIGPQVAIWGIRRTRFPPEDSPLLYRASNLLRVHFSKLLLRKLPQLTHAGEAAPSGKSMSPLEIQMSRVVFHFHNSQRIHSEGTHVQG